MKIMTIAGRITKDAELVIRQDIPVTNFSVAVNDRKTTAKKDENGKRIYNEKTDFIRVTLWRDQAKAMVPYLQKGRLISVSGDFDFEMWMDKKNVGHATAHFTSPKIELLDASRKPEEPAEEPSVDPEELPFE